MSFEQQSNYAAKISNLTSTVKKKMTVDAKNNYTRAIKLDLTFLTLVSLFLRFSLVFLAAEEDYKTYNQKQSEVNELTTTYDTYAGVLRHAQQ